MSGASQNSSAAKTLSMRGRGGGYLPKNRSSSAQGQHSHQKPTARNSSSEKENDTELSESVTAKLKEVKVTASEEEKEMKPAEKDGMVASPKADSTNEKRCDFCGDPKHMSWVCPIFALSNQPPKPGHSKKEIVCFYCKAEGHVKSECPKRKTTCFYCKEEGHHIADCVKRAQKAAKREKESASRVVNYTFRKTSQEHPTTDNNTSNFVTKAYDGHSDNEDDDDGGDEQKKEDKKEEKKRVDSVKEKPRVIVPMPVPASSIKPQVQLRSKLLSSDSEPSLSPNTSSSKQQQQQQQGMAIQARPESSEEEDGTEGDTEESGDEEEDEAIAEDEKEAAKKQEDAIKKKNDDDEPIVEQPTVTEIKTSEGAIEEVVVDVVVVDGPKKEEAAAVDKDQSQTEEAKPQQQQPKKAHDTNEDELETITVSFDGCVEFDSDSDSYRDCSDGEDRDGSGQLKRIPEEDEYYGEHGALVDLEEPMDKDKEPKKEEDNKDKEEQNDAKEEGKDVKPEQNGPLEEPKPKGCCSGLV